MRARLLPPLLAAALASLAPVSVSHAAPAKTAPKSAAKSRGKPNPQVEQAKTLLNSGDRAQIEAGIQSLGLLGTPDAVPPLVERIRFGLAPDLLDTAIVTLMALGQPTAAPVLFDLASHRRPEVRLRAIEAVISLAPKGA